MTGLVAAWSALASGTCSLAMWGRTEAAAAWSLRLCAAGRGTGAAAAFGAACAPMPRKSLQRPAPAVRCRSSLGLCRREKVDAPANVSLQKAAE